jgi:DNA-binding response OmpR family regulator
MPEKEGLETLLDLRREFPNVMTIAMSGGSERAKINLLELAQRLGAQYRLTKPFQLQTVIGLVNTALGKKGNVSFAEGSREAIGPDGK